MGDLINRDKFLETHGGMWSMSMYVGYASDLKAFNEGRKSVIDMLKNEKPVDAEPVRHGHWIYDPDGMDWNIPAWICSECGFVCDYLPTTLGKKQVVNAMLKRFAGSHFCPNCGAKMDMEE